MNLNEPIIDSLQNVWNVIAQALPNIFGAIVVFLIGLILAAICEIITSRIIRGIKLDSLLRKAGLEEFLEKGSLKLDSGKFLGKCVYWFIVIAFVLAASEILGFAAFTDFVKQIVYYIPNIIIAILIVLATIILANFLKGVVKASIKSTKLTGANFLAALTWWMVMIFGIASALIQLKIATFLINAILIGIISMLVLAGGIALGLGGKDYAASLLEKFKETFEK